MQTYAHTRTRAHVHMQITVAQIDPAEIGLDALAELLELVGEQRLSVMVGMHRLETVNACAEDANTDESREALLEVHVCVFL